MSRQTERLLARQLRVVKAMLRASADFFEKPGDFERFFDDFGINIRGPLYGGPNAAQMERAGAFFAQCSPSEAREILREWLKLCEYAGIAKREEGGYWEFQDSAFSKAEDLVRELAPPQIA